MHLPARPAAGSGFRKAPCGRVAVNSLSKPFKAPTTAPASRSQHDRGEPNRYASGHEIHTSSLKAPNAGRHDRGDRQERPNNDQRGKGPSVKRKTANVGMAGAPHTG